MLFNTSGKRTPHKPLLAWEFAGSDFAISPCGSRYDTTILFNLNKDGPQKQAARQRVLDLFHPDAWPFPLRIITMPGLHWKFERKLLGKREGDWMSKPAPQRTKFFTAEYNRAIFAASIRKIPGIHKSTIRETAFRQFAEIGIQTDYVMHYFCNMDDFLAHDWGSVGKKWNAAWLDYTGPLSIERLNLIKNFYNRYLTQGTLIITALKARWNKETVDAIGHAGGYFYWLRYHLPGYVLHDIEYMDTSPMAQYAVARW